MSETTNYGLFVSNDDQMTFREWRLKLSGETDSNMTKIDAALGEMQGRLDNVVQADFEESNPESPAYIQNRTHWKEVVGEDAEIIPQQTATFTALGAATVTGVAQGMKEGVKYVASIGGLELEGRCKKYGYELYIGNASLMNSALENTGEGFCVNYFADTNYLLFVRNAATGASLKFSMRSVQEVTYHKLDKAYLPDDLSSVDGVGRVGSGENSAIFNNYDLNIASGGYSHAEGSGTESSNLTSHAEGFATRASGMASHSEGSGTEASGMAAHSEGAGSVASGGSAHAEGSNTKAYGMFSHTEGNATEAVNDNSHAQGLSTKATGRSTDVIGEFNAYEGIIKDDLYSGIMETDEDKSGYTVYAFSSSDFALSEDESSIIIMNYTEKDMLYLSPGDYYVTNLDDVYTEINECVSNNSIDGSTTGGYTKHNVGYVKYTVASKSKDRGSFAHVVGNGRSENERSNAHTLDWEGNAWFAGDVYVKSTSGKNRDNGSLRLVTTEDLAEVASASGSVVWGSF